MGRGERFRGRAAGTFAPDTFHIFMSLPFKNQLVPCIVRGAAALLSGMAFSALAQSPDSQSLPLTTVTHVSDAERMPYADFISGMDAFERDHGLAPDATLRFTVIPRDRSIDPGTLSLRLVDPHETDLPAIDIPVDSRGNFDVPRVDTLIGKDAEIRANLPAGTLHWRPLVATPNVPNDARRMGDLRLECEVKEAGGLNRPDIPFIGRIFGNPGIKECYTDDEHVFLAPAPLSGVVLEGSDHQVLLQPERIGESSRGAVLPRMYTVFESYLRPRAFSPPLGDATLPNDALVHFEFSATSQPEASR